MILSDTPKIEILNTDCMEILRTMPDKAFDLAIVDPPYGIGVDKMAYTQENNRPCKQKNGTILRVKKLRYKHGNWDKESPSQEYFDELNRISKNQIIWGIEYFNWIGLDKGRIKWNKLVPEGMSFKKYEMAYCSLIKNTISLDLLWAGMCQAESLSNPTKQQGNKKLNEMRIHPTQKPVMLYKWLLINYAKPGDKILDTHSGSLSIGIACHRLGFDLLAIEKDNHYYEASIKRFKQITAQQTIF